MFSIDHVFSVLIGYPSAKVVANDKDGNAKNCFNLQQMMNTEEKMMPSVEEEEKEAESEEEEEEEDDESGGEKICDSNDGEEEEEEGKGGVKKEVEATLQATGEKILLPIDATEKKQQANVLNLNNEVVKMWIVTSHGADGRHEQQ